jgi:hypothetical protein
MVERLYTEAWAEAEASAPGGDDGDERDTVELRHPALDGPMRLVSGLDDQTFRLEAGAPNGAGEMKLFTAVPFQFGRPAIGPDRTPEMPFILDNCARELAPYIDALVADRTPMKVRFRSYLMSDPEEVAWGPWELTLSGGLISGPRFTAVCRLASLQRLTFPRKTFDRETFPTLIAAY